MLNKLNSGLLQSQCIRLCTIRFYNHGSDLSYYAVIMLPSFCRRRRSIQRFHQVTVVPYKQGVNASNESMIGCGNIFFSATKIKTEIIVFGHKEKLLKVSAQHLVAYTTNKARNLGLTSINNFNIQIKTITKSSYYQHTVRIYLELKGH